MGKCENCHCGGNCHAGRRDPASSCHSRESGNPVNLLDPGSCEAQVRDDIREKDHIQVCESKTCGPKWSRDIMSELERSLGLKEGTENEKMRLEYRGCLGYCEEANNVAVNGNILSNVIPSEAVTRVEEARKLPPGDFTKGEFKDLNLDDDAFLGL